MKSSTCYIFYFPISITFNVRISSGKACQIVIDYYIFKSWVVLDNSHIKLTGKCVYESVSPLIVDGVWPDYNSDLAFRNKIVVQPFGDGTFRYLSNSIEQIELELPPIARRKG